MYPRPSRFTLPVAIAFLLAASAAPLRASDVGRPKLDLRARPLALSPELDELVRTAPAAPKERLSPAWRRVGAALRQTVARAERAGTTGLSSAICRVRADCVAAVTLRVARLGDPERVALAACGCDVTFASERDRFVEAWVPLDRVGEVAALDFVTSARPTAPAVASAGSVTSEGDAILAAADARRSLGVTGRGVKVGVISDSVDGLADAAASGDVPPDVDVLSFGVGAGEGTAMLEIVHDLAPDAPLAFHGALTTGDMLNAITRLAGAGCRVIVDDLLYRDEPFFEDGVIARTMNDVAARGVVYVTAAGNDGVNNDQRDFDGAGSLGGPTHDVQGYPDGSGLQGFTVPPRSSIVIFMQWSNPFGSSADDYDLYVVDQNGTIVAQSDDEQNGDDVPIEAVQVDNASSAPARFFAIVDRFRGAPQRINIAYDRRIRDLEFGSPVSSIGNAQSALGAITVGTINAGDPGNDTLAFYSSQGPCDIFFPTPERRVKPDVTGIDGVAVTGAAGFANPFFGTSAAAPHVAAIAALMLEADPFLTPGAVKESLQRSAFDFGAPGLDAAFGAGRVGAVDAVLGYPVLEAAGIVNGRLVVAGAHFAPGAAILVDGVAFRTKADRQRPSNVLSSKRAAKAAGSGRTVILQVRNPDGRLSLGGSFRR